METIVVEGLQVELIAAAGAVPATSPAYATVLHHRMRLQREAGEHDQVRSELDRLLPAIEKEQTRSALNVFLTHRLALARSTAEFVRFAPRRAVGVTWADEAGAEEDKAGQALLDQDGAAMLNRGMSFALWMAALNDQALPAGIGARLLTAAFPRAVLLRDHASAAALLRRLGSSVANVGDYLRAATPAERDFAAAYVMLKNPGFRLEAEAGLPIREKAPHSELDTYAANWWCALDTGAAPSPAPFLNEGQKSAFEKEWRVLSAAPGAPVWLSRQAVEWAAANPGDPRSPEALHLAVRATRYGCGNGMGNYGAASKAAFDLLHKRWPNSEWAKKTRYWFN